MRRGSEAPLCGEAELGHTVMSASQSQADTDSQDLCRQGTTTDIAACQVANEGPGRSRGLSRLGDDANQYLATTGPPKW
jgi:hypothetical protein